MSVDRLLLENGDFLLLESGDKLLLESSTVDSAADLGWLPVDRMPTAFMKVEVTSY